MCCMSPFGSVEVQKQRQTQMCVRRGAEAWQQVNPQVNARVSRQSGHRRRPGRWKTAGFKCSVLQMNRSATYTVERSSHLQTPKTVTRPRAVTVTL